ncbi:MAG: class I SAM-dependent methyltransferase [Chloroflexi bacterium]|nr:class I SAM-dependent methyltransferase [Chloroflexota bacterium]
MATIDGSEQTPDEIKEIVRRHWAGRAATFDERPNHGLHGAEQRNAWLTAARGWAAQTAAGALDVLDVGCGTGFLATLFARLGHRAVGIDAADEMLDLARTKASTEGLAVVFQRADAESLPFPDQSFDLLVERHVIWTLPRPSVALGEWTRVLRPGGRLVLVEGDWCSASHADYEPIRDALPLYGGRPATELARYLAVCGLVNVAEEPLMNAVLWGERPDRPRYALSAWKPR